MEYTCLFLVSFTATTSGVVLALLLQKWYEGRKETNETESIKCKLNVELQKIKNIMLNIHRAKETEFFLSPIKMPIFQGFVNSTKIALLDKYSWYNDMLNLYKYLDTYNAWHDLKTNKSLINNIANPESSKYNSLINISLLEIEKIVLGLSNIEETKRSKEENEIVSNDKHLKDNDENVIGLIDCVISKISIKTK